VTITFTAMGGRAAAIYFRRKRIVYDVPPGERWVRYRTPLGMIGMFRSRNVVTGFVNRRRVTSLTVPRVV